MDSILAKPFTGDQVIWMLLIVCLTAGTIAKIIVGYRHKSQQSDIDATLKMEMIQRGMSADEIERVLRARTRGSAVSKADAESGRIAKHC